MDALETDADYDRLLQGFSHKVKAARFETGGTFRSDVVLAGPRTMLRVAGPGSWRITEKDWGVILEDAERALTFPLQTRPALEDPNVPSSIPEISETTEIPGNLGLSETARAAWTNAVFRPYHDTIAAALDRRAAAGRASVLVALHSFTPIFKGVARPWHAAVLYNRDARLARCLFELLSAEDGLIVGDNEPYGVSDLTDYTVPVHAERRGLPYVEIEIRQDQITEAAGQRDWAERLARLLPAAYAEFLRRWSH
jgi:hypothetical protein